METKTCDVHGTPFARKMTYHQRIPKKLTGNYQEDIEQYKEMVRHEEIICRVCYFVANPPDFDDDISCPDGYFIPDASAPYKMYRDGTLVKEI